MEISIDFLQGLKRSVTTLRGGTLGYAEIVAVKVRNEGKNRERQRLEDLLGC